MKKRLSILLSVLLTSMVSMAATHEYVDLGLPSGTLWATCNVGASAPEGYGSYFAWGETTTKSTYSWSNYKYASGTAATAIYIGDFLPNNSKVTSIQGTQYDAAKAQWGSDWVMPSKDQVHELIQKCSVSAKTVNGVKGVQYKGPNGNTMFLPCGGFKSDATHTNKGTEGYYWSGTGDVYDLDKSRAVALYNKSSSTTTAKNIQRRTGANIRAVRASGGSTEPATADPEAVDLGLSVKWATFNVGATSKEKSGTYFAWGETSKKSSYTWANYQHASGSSTTCKSIGSDISATQYDAASKAWGDDWRMPTASEIDELLTKCTWTAATVNSVKGYTVKGPSGKTIFLPFAGCSYEGKTYGTGSYTYYWSSEVSEGATGAKAYALYPKSGTSTTKTSIQRRTGAVIRPVKGAGVTPTPTPEEMDLVDLGLSVSWANMNIEANSPEKAGYYYAWGETAKKSTYTWANYKHSNGTQATAKYIGDDISGDGQYDAAYFWSNALGEEAPCGVLSLPTEEQWQELISKCTWTSTTKNGVKGYTVKGPSGKSIFLPLSGCSYEGKTYTDNSYYWTANYDASTAYKAHAVKLTASAKSVTTIQRRTGAAIRAVAYIEHSTIIPVTPPPALSPELVDLGLSVKWSNQDVGSTCPGLFGDYFAWGETATKSKYTWANYKHANGTQATAKNIGSNISGTSYDAAYLDDNAMCLPTVEQWNELISKCTFKLVDCPQWDDDLDDYVEGKAYEVTGPNGNSIMLPLSGSSYEGKEYGVGTNAYYWTANNDASTAYKAQAVFLTTTSKSVTSIQRRTGAAIRAVERVVDVPADEVDLGLSVTWASYNIGATSKEGYGNYYAWGETSKKSSYTWSNYQHASGSSTTCKSIGSDISATQYDVASEVWGDDWRMPTAEEIDELRTKCTWTAATVNGVKGYTVKGPSGKTIFLPFAGCSYEGKDYGAGSYTYYWSSEVSEGATGAKAYALYPKSGTSTTKASIQRRTGAVIRPVKTAAVKEAYAVLSSDKTTLTFYYDSDKASRSGTKYAMNTGTNKPGWNEQKDNITKVVFNSSFANARPVTCRFWFWNFSKLTTITGIQYLNTSQVTDMYFMFCGCEQLKSLDLSKFDTSNVKDMGCMFSDCYNLGSLNLSGFNTSKVTNMSGMFLSCKSLTSLNLSSFNTSNVTNMRYMFEYCEQLKNLNITSFNTSNVKNMSEMFYVCKKLEELDLSHFSWMCVTNSDNMFAQCPSLERLYLNWSFSLYQSNLSASTFSGIGTASNPCKLYGFAGYVNQWEYGKTYYTLLGGYFTTDFVDLELPSGNLWASCDLVSDHPLQKYMSSVWSGLSKYIPSSPILYKGKYYYLGLPTTSDFNELSDRANPFNGKKDNKEYVGWHPTGSGGYLVFAYDTGWTYLKYWCTSYNTNYAYTWTYTKDVGSSTDVEQKNTFLHARIVARPASSANGAEFDTTETDGISMPEMVDTFDDAPVYNLQGMKVEGALKPGVYIKNGRKFVVK